MNMITYGLSVLVLVVKVREWICMNRDCVSSVFSLLLDSFSDFSDIPVLWTPERSLIIINEQHATDGLRDPYAVKLCARAPCGSQNLPPVHHQ